MPLAILPEKNTFVHFQEDEDPLNRSATCPGNYIPSTRATTNGWTPPAASSWDADCNAAGSSSSHNIVPLAPPFLMPQSCEADDASSTLQRTDTFSGRGIVSSQAPWAKVPVTVTNESSPLVESPWPATPSTLPGTPCRSDTEASDKEESAAVTSSKKKRWADLVSDDDASPICRTNGETPVASPAGEKRRCADLSEEKPDYASSPREEDEESEHMAAFKTQRRPQFSRPTRETRNRQLRAKVDECFELDFDQVDPSQQDGLTHRMLVTLKSLGESISFWTLDGDQVTEEAFHLFGLEEADMYAIGRLIRKADKLLEERRFRDAYDELRKAHGWFDPETLEEERLSARAHAERAAERKRRTSNDHKIQKDGGSDEWSTVIQKKNKKGVNEASLKLEQSGHRKGSKIEETSDEWSTVIQKKNKKGVNEASLKLEQSGQRKGSKIEERPGAISKPQKYEQQARNAAKGQHAPHRASAKARNAPQKFLCRYIVGIEQNRSFNVVRKLLGDHGAHMREIAENTGAKLRIRGRGSGFKEGPDNVEADEPLMICVSAMSPRGFADTTKDVESLLKHVHDQYYAFCEERNLPRPKLVVEQTEQPQLPASR